MTERQGTARPLCAFAALSASVLLLSGCTGADPAPAPKVGPRGDLPTTWLAATKSGPAPSGGLPVVDLASDETCALGWRPDIGGERAVVEGASTRTAHRIIVHQCTYDGPAAITAGVVRFEDGFALEADYEDMVAAGASQHPHGRQTIALLHRTHPDKRTEYLLKIADPKKQLAFDVRIEPPADDPDFDAAAAVALVMTAFD
ncbi:hypothetical protein CLV63_12050 [Murinocardiopsis flavida]|uniref:Uncharacterized protein n=1 Tax=Murinocardiopsis flavida TaxID=645275 RepID=A0A2P8D275_9ACTN|nr:hypothetical protein [Murinocardiopsis flavida]PSK91324.1 hypothetical protein CLV63_12050 [Murinocardiopsis flavida]